MTESYHFKIEVDRVVSWLIQKVHESNLDPISITPADLDQYEDIQNALSDRRSLQKIEQIKADDCYLTPDFLETFDLQNIVGRDYLKVRMRFAASKLGFIA